MPSVKDITSIMRSPSKEDMALVERAYGFAERSHEGHVRFSGEPFFTHVFAVAKTLAEFGMGAQTVAAGLLHDVIEDTPATAEDVRAEFGDEVLSLVEGVTKLGTLKYRGLTRHVESLRKLFVAVARDIRVLIIKFADRLHNMQTLEHVPAHKRRRIAEETLEIYAPLAYRLGMRALNRELEDLAFPFVYPEEHLRVVALLKEKHAETGEHLRKVHRTIRKILARDGVRDAKTSFRLKGLYSLFRKLERKEMDISKVYDVSALRIVVPTVADCYRALGLVHNTWRPLPGRIKDYIAFPKPNGYRSLHTTIFTGGGGIVEIQIRTEEMHRTAEYGIASHFTYKEGGDRRSLLAHLAWLGQLLSYRYWFQSARANGPALAEARGPKAPLWLRELAEAQEGEVQDPKEFLEHLRADFFEHRVFVFTPQGDVVDLPLGASPIDFAYAIHSEIGNRLAGAKVNGKLVSLDTSLRNGDIVEIETRQSAHPSAKWLELVKTNLARRKIRVALGK
jgi:GTP pyrophosphokinase